MNNSLYEIFEDLIYSFDDEPELENFKQEFNKFISRGGKIDHHNEKSITLLVKSILSNNIDILSFLIDNDADINIICKNKTAIFYACQVGNTQMINILLENPKCNIYQIIEGNNIFHSLAYAADINNFNLIKDIFIKDKKDYLKYLDQPNHKDFTPLFYAILSLSFNYKHKNLKLDEINDMEDNIYDFVIKLINEGVDISYRPMEGLRYFDLIGYNDQTEYFKIFTYKLAKYFIKEKKIDVNDYTNKDDSLIYASIGNIPLLKLLLENGADINCIRETGDTPLINAIDSNNIDSVDFLLKNGANINLTNEYGLDCVLVSIKNESFDILYLLLENGIDIFKEYNCIVKKEKYGIRYEVSNLKNYRLLHLVCEIGNEDLIEKIIKLGDNLDDKKGCSKSPNEVLKENEDIDQVIKDFLNAEKISYSEFVKKIKSGDLIYEDSCPICIGEWDSRLMIGLDCKHIFHNECLLNMYRGSYGDFKCPVCRSDVKIICKSRIENFGKFINTQSLSDTDSNINNNPPEKSIFDNRFEKVSKSLETKIKIKRKDVKKYRSLSGLNRKFISQKIINDKERKKIGKKRKEQKNEMYKLLERDREERLRLLEKKKDDE